MVAIFVGEEPYSSDPTVSEWSNPPRRYVGGTCRENNRKIEIAACGAPPELKHLSRVRKRNSIEIPQVAASENGTA